MMKYGIEKVMMKFGNGNHSSTVDFGSNGDLAVQFLIVVVYRITLDRTSIYD